MFTDRFQEMGLEQITPNSYYYGDQHSDIIYELMKTKDSERDVPLLSIWTKLNTSNDYNFQGVVSLFYNFIGNNNLNQRIKDSVSEIGSPVFREYLFLNDKLTRMYNEMLIQNKNHVPEAGDVYPQIIVSNSYDGYLGAEVSFGLCLYDTTETRHSFGFRTKLSSFKQIHSQYARARLSTAVGDYINVVSENIIDLIKINFETKVTEQSLISTLDLVEKIGKRRRKEISDVLQQITKDKDYISCWDLFLAITRFSCIEKNLNAKILLEDIVEATLVIPTKMMDSLKEINS